MEPNKNGSLPSTRKRSRAPAVALGVLLGVALTVGVIFAISIARRGETLPRVTREDLEAAARRWTENGPASYDMDIMVGGGRPGPVHIEVRVGRVTRMTRDGVVPAQSRTWEYWTVPGQLETIRQDFDSAETPGGFGVLAVTETVFRGEFDPRYGYPRRYQRNVLGTNLDVEWTATSFKAIE
ncbi:MAG: hypothetical protein HYX69_15755 [Planctomycetia bacterium]|nr:hypothetical protein [Planctomycetia bacterium]